MPILGDRSFVGAGVSFPFEFTTKFGGVLSQTSTSVSAGEERIRQSLLQILYTTLGERVMNRGFGAGIRGLLFEPMDPVSLDQFLYVIRKAIDRHEHRVRVSNLSASLIDGKNGLLQIDLAFVDIRTNQPGNMVFPYYVGGGNVTPSRISAARTA